CVREHRGALAFRMRIALLFVRLGNFYCTTLCKENNSMVARVSVMVLRIAALLALILGILFWFGVIQGAESFKNPWTSIHMTLGVIVTICLVILGVLMVTTKGGNVGLGVGAIVMALL